MAQQIDKTVIETLESSFSLRPENTVPCPKCNRNKIEYKTGSLFGEDEPDFFALACESCGCHHFLLFINTLPEDQLYYLEYYEDVWNQWAKKEYARMI